MIPRHWIFSSDGFSVRLTTAELKDYDRERKALENRYMLLEQARRGLWAGNQNRYVQRTADMNEWDRMPRVLNPKFKPT
jgi:hypothetical protein